MNKKFIFDLDNTLIFTNNLNTEAYNYALELYGLEPINDFGRITREVVKSKYPYITKKVLSRIVASKQKFFKKNLSKTKPNESLLRLLYNADSQNCILWTSANKKRVKLIIKHYNLKSNFKKIVFSHKKHINVDILKITRIFNCNPEDLIFYDDNAKIIKLLRKNQIEANLIR